MKRYLFRLTNFVVPKDMVVRFRGVRQLATVRRWQFADGNVSWRLEKKS